MSAATVPARATDVTVRLALVAGEVPAGSGNDPAQARFGRGTLAASNGSVPAVLRIDGVALYIHGRLRFEGRAVGDPDSHARLVAAWRRDGPGVCARLGGEFSLIMADADTGAWLAAVDRFSTYRLYFTQADGQVVIGTAPIAVARAAGGDVSPSAEAILAYAYFHVIPAPLSIVAGVRRLDHGECLWGEGRGGCEVRRYWTPHFDEHRPFQFAAERERFLTALRAGVAESVEGQSADAVGCFLSGGTDSSTIAGLVTEHFGVGARTFSIGFGVSGYDETHFARLAVDRFGTRHTEYYLQPADVEQGLPLIATRYEQPFGNASAVPTYFCASIAREAGVQRMLGGDGGDELYGGNERYAKQWLFSRWQAVPAPIRAGFVEPLLFGPLRGVAFGPVRKARSYIEQTRVPLPDRLQAKYNLLERFGRANVFTERFLACAHAFEPEDLAREVWARSDAESQINRLLAFDFKFTLADSDLPKVTGMCEAAGVEVAYPMLTQPVTDHSLTLAPDQKLHGRQLRYFFKNALRGFLPDEILAKEKHGFGMPFGAWMLSRPELAAMADDALAGLAGRGYVRPEFIAELRSAVAGGHPGYYGTMVWVLVVLELWLREHLPDAHCA